MIKFDGRNIVYEGRDKDITLLTHLSVFRVMLRNHILRGNVISLTESQLILLDPILKDAGDKLIEKLGAENGSETSSRPAEQSTSSEVGRGGI